MKGIVGINLIPSIVGTLVIDIENPLTSSIIFPLVSAEYILNKFEGFIDLGFTIFPIVTESGF